MELNKYCELRYFRKGVQELRKCYYSELIFDKIPLYYSMNTDKADVLKLEDNSVIIIANQNFRRTLDENQFKIYLLHKILKIVLGTNKKFIYDLHIAKWFSCTEALNYIKVNVKNKDEKQLRTENIYEYVNTIDKIKILSINDVVNTLKVVKVK